MARRNTLLSFAALLVTISAGAATSAHAQLGKLKKIGADAAKDAALGKKPEPPKDPTAASITYDITAERLNAIVVALTPILAAAQREADAKAVAAGYDAKYKAANDCFTKAASGGTPDLSGIDTDKYEAMSTKMGSIATRLTAAMNAKRYRESAALQDTAAVLQVLVATAMFKTNCPVVPYKPAAMIDALAAQMERQASGAVSSSNELDVPADARAGMTTGQWGRVRERIAVWLLIQSKDLPATTERFTDAEQAVLASRAADIKKFGPLFKSGTMQWVHWTDVKAW